MTNEKLAIAAALLLIACPACSSDSSGYGTISPEVIELYDQGAPTGMMELEIDRSGKIYEAEADIDPRKLPQVVLDAARAVAGEGAVLTGAEIEYGTSGKAYEVKFEKGGVGYEYVIDPMGNVREQEREIDRTKAPAGIVEAGLEVLPGSFKSVEILELGGGEIVYHVKTDANGVSYKAVIASDRRVLRAVREAGAEIEIPLTR